MEQWPHDNQFMLKAVKQDGKLLLYSGLFFTRKDELTLEAAKECGFVFEFSQKLFEARIKYGYNDMYLPFIDSSKF